MAGSIIVFIIGLVVGGIVEVTVMAIINISRSGQ